MRNSVLEEKSNCGKVLMTRYPSCWYNQSGVIPFWIKNNEIQIMLITSRSGKRWVIPKGTIESDLSSLESAEKEAFEEAGVLGNAHASEIGKYQYNKWGGTCTVEVFLLEVEKVLQEWPESQFRQREWLKVEEAAARVNEEALKKLIWGVPKLLNDIRHK